MQFNFYVFYNNFYIGAENEKQFNKILKTIGKKSIRLFKPVKYITSPTIRLYAEFDNDGKYLEHAKETSIPLKNLDIRTWPLN